MFLFSKKHNSGQYIKNSNILIAICAICIGLFFAHFIPDIAHAQFVPSQPDIPQGDGFVPPDDRLLDPAIAERDIRALTIRVVQYFLSFLGLAATVVLIYGGLLMVFSGGNEDNVNKGKNIVLYSAIGIILLLSAFTIVNFLIGAVAPTGIGDDPLNRSVGGESPEFSQEAQIQFQEEVQALRTDIERLLQSFSNIQVILAEVDRIFLARIEKILREIDVRDDGSIEIAVQELIAIEDPLNTDDNFVLRQIIVFLEKMTIVRDSIIDFFGRMPNTPENQNALESQLDILQGILISPERTDLVRELIDTFDDFQKKVENSEIMIANIRATPFRGSAPLTVVFDGTGSFDPTLTTIPDSNYSWWYVDNNGQEVILNRGPIQTVTFNNPGKYIVNLKVETSTIENGIKAAIDGLTYVEIIVEPPTAEVLFNINNSPSSNFSNITVGQAQSGLIFDPTKSRSSIGRNFTNYTWDFGDGTIREFATPDTIEHFYGQEGIYRMSLTITDDAGNRNRKDLAIQVKSIAANININPEIGDATTEYNFDATRSASMNGDITDYKWEVLQDGSPIDEFFGPVFPYTFPQPGTYQVSLAITDTLGNQDRSTRLITVNSQNPIAAFNWKIADTSTPSTIAFDASKSFDNDENDILTYDWDFDGDKNFEIIDSANSKIQHQYDKVGEYTVTLVARDQYGGQGRTTQKIQVDSVLDVTFDISPLSAQVGKDIIFTADSKNATSHYWSFGDQSSRQTEKNSTNYSYKESGIYEASVTVYDAEDNETTATRKVFISDDNSPMAIAKAYKENTEIIIQPDLCGRNRPGIQVSRKDLISFDASLSLNVDGTNKGLVYLWDFGNGETSTDKKASQRYDEITINNECYRAQLTVSDRATGAVDTSNIIYVKVSNLKPTFTRLLVLPPNEKQLVTPIPVNLEVIGSTDADGNISAYRFWYYYRDSDQKFGLVTVSKPSTQMSVIARGQQGLIQEVFFAAEVIDNENASTSSEELGISSIPITVENGKNLPPEIEIKASATNIFSGDDVTFFAEATDPQGYEIPESNYAWDFDGDGIYDDTSSGSQVSHSYEIPGEYEVKSKVTSTGGLSTTARLSIFVERLSKYPLSAFLFNVNGLEVSFDGSNSQFDPSIPNNSLQYQWDFDMNTDSNGDGDPQNDIDSVQISPTFIYQEKRKYRAKLTVVDILQGKDDVIREIDLQSDSVAPQQKSAPKITSNTHGLTSLDITIQNAQVRINETTEIRANILNADGSQYTGKVSFELLEGSAEILPQQIEAKQSQAKALITPFGEGYIEILVTAFDTIHGEISDTIIIEVK